MGGRFLRKSKVYEKWNESWQCRMLMEIMGVFAEYREYLASEAAMEACKVQIDTDTKEAWVRWNGELIVKHPAFNIEREKALQKLKGLGIRRKVRRGVKDWLNRFEEVDEVFQVCPWLKVLDWRGEEFIRFQATKHLDSYWTSEHKKLEKARERAQEKDLRELSVIPQPLASWGPVVCGWRREKDKKRGKAVTGQSCFYRFIKGK